MYERAATDATLEAEDFGDSKADPKAFAVSAAMVLNLLGRGEQARRHSVTRKKVAMRLPRWRIRMQRRASGGEGALRGWIEMAKTGDLYQLIYESKAGNLDFPFEASEIYLPGGIVSSFLNTHADADKNPGVLWGVLDALGFRPLQRTAADLNGDGVNEFFVVTQEGGTSPNQAQSLWFIYKIVPCGASAQSIWRIRSSLKVMRFHWQMAKGAH